MLAGWLDMAGFTESCVIGASVVHLKRVVTESGRVYWQPIVAREDGWYVTKTQYETRDTALMFADDLIRHVDNGGGCVNVKVVNVWPCWGG